VCFFSTALLPVNIEGVWAKKSHQKWLDLKKKRAFLVKIFS
jgi:hypothetical protein